MSRTKSRKGLRNGKEPDNENSVAPATKELEKVQVEIISSIRTSVKATHQTFRANFYVNIVIVVLGILLILIATVQSILQGIDSFSVTFGGLGVASFVTVFLLNPQSRLQENLCRLSQMNVIFTNFLYEYDNFVTVTRDDSDIDIDKLTEINKEGERIVSFALRMISNLVAAPLKKVDGNESE